MLWPVRLPSRFMVLSSVNCLSAHDCGPYRHHVGIRGLAARCFRPSRSRRPVMTLIRISASSLKEGRWYEYLIRFALGRGATVFTGFISSRYGALVGGLFLALPAIFCASATLIKKHEIRRKREAGLPEKRRGQMTAALDSAGAVLGALGMVAFAALAQGPDVGGLTPDRLRRPNPPGLLGGRNW